MASAYNSWAGRRVIVIFGYDTSITFGGVIIEDEPRKPTVIQLDDGRVVKGPDCQYKLEPK